MPTRRLVATCLLVLLVAACGPKGAKQYNDGVEKCKQQKYKEAITALEKAVELNPEFAEAFLAAGLCQYYAQDYQKGMESTQKGIALLEAGKAAKTECLRTPAQKRAVGHWHLGLIQVALYKQSMVKSEKTALDHLKQARAEFKKARQLDDRESLYADRLTEVDELLKRMGA